MQKYPTVKTAFFRHYSSNM